VPAPVDVFPDQDADAAAQTVSASARVVDALRSTDLDKRPGYDLSKCVL